MHKFVQQVDSIFKNLPKPLKWRSFLTHDLILLTDIPLKVQKTSVKLDLNKAQTKCMIMKSAPLGQTIVPPSINTCLKKFKSLRDDGPGSRGVRYYQWASSPRYPAIGYFLFRLA